MLVRVFCVLAKGPAKVVPAVPAVVQPSCQRREIGCTPVVLAVEMAPLVNRCTCNSCPTLTVVDLFSLDLVYTIKAKTNTS